MLGRHRVEGRGEPGDLVRPADRGARREIAVGQPGGGVPDPADRLRDPAREEKPGGDGRGRRACGDGQHLPVRPHVEHHPARCKHRSERDTDGDEREPRQLEPDGGSRSERVGDGDADREAGRRDDDAEEDHGSSL